MGAQFSVRFWRVGKAKNPGLPRVLFRDKLVTGIGLKCGCGSARFNLDEGGRDSKLIRCIDCGTPGGNQMELLRL